MESVVVDSISVAKTADEESRSIINIPVLNAPEPPTLWEELSGSIKEAVLPQGSRFSFLSWILSAIYGLFPVLRWGRSYSFKSFRSDLMAGLTLASLGIPQSIGYASLAKLDPQYGLYTSIVPPLIYAVMGTSKDIAIGPVAVVSLLLSSMIQKVVDPAVDPIAYRKVMFTATFFAGLFQISFGLFRLGFLVDFLSHAAIVGFMGAAAIVIGLQQLKGLLGISHFTNSTDVVSVVKAVWAAVHQPWNPDNFVIGCSFLIFILMARFIARRKKKLFWLTAISPLLCVVLSTLLVFVTRADRHGVKIIQHVNGGLNPSSAKDLQLRGPYVGKCAKIGLIAAVIALTEAISVGRSFASVKGYQIDGNKEMMAMGVMNVAGSLSSCYVSTGSFSRTAVNFSAGCKTAVSNIVMAITAIIALQFLARLLYYTPVAILASIILSALPGLIDIKEACNIWEVDKMDFLTCIGAFFGVLFGSVEIGLLVAITISFAKIIVRSIRPHIEMLGRMQGTNVFCSVRQYPVASQTPGILLLRIDSSFLCFMNANFIRERIIHWVATEEGDATKKMVRARIQSVIIDMSNVMNIDTSGIAAVTEIHKELVLLSIQLAIANPGWQVIHKMKLARLIDMIGGAWIFLTVGEAVEACLGANKNNGYDC
ncbi:low affinity sulfate transporter 3 [Typha angustifolia]|uniref:low affinity sulfate transporter 3 n=1 Tax=Typha angustifolia TaxID=59011 RepID=UPI003C2C14D1